MTIAPRYSGWPSMRNPIELHLPDGGHIMLSIAAWVGDDQRDELMALFAAADGSQRDIASAMTAIAEDLDLPITRSTGHSPTVVIIG